MKYLITFIILIFFVPSLAGTADDYMKSGYSLLNQKKYNEAFDDFEKAVKIDPVYVDAWLGRGVCLYYLGKSDEALSSFDRAISINPNDDMAWYTKGYVLFNLGIYHKSILCFDRTLEINPDDDYAKKYRRKAAENLFKCKCSDCNKNKQ
ncbi:MAG: tetratricopeptide repeat protein [Candidatus Eremiobacterota bacterium]